ncbi:hypothetical protein NP233_g12647 [Leucocoprinus birnbaumii]|uniref:Fungal-type protein kinase domain-containing protein n=1 Tax=Leucocoprinus birnbaumii TaxID=56174 RepID=A0AAD5VJP8_9AGAR|nr:hypothetical protein NP233_g12647 [Leucocoprinus birnbaumii]
MNFELDAAEFLEKFLPFSDGHASALWEEMKKEGLYSDSEWTDFHASNSAGATVKELSLYESFAEIANRIASRAPAIMLGLSEVSSRLKGRWVNTRSQALVLGNQHANAFMPDITFLSEPEADDLAQLSIAPTVDATVDAIHMNKPSQVSEEVDQGVAEPPNSSPSTELKFSRLWLRAFTVVEVKSAPRDALPQLATYVRQLFMEQVDRHFIIAFTFTLPLLRIHLFDRSGVISSTGINVHNSPKDFISAIAAFSCRTAVELGWDPTVRVWDQKKVMHSYTAPMKGYSSTYDVPWVFEGFAKSGQSDPPQYVFIRSETLQDATRLWGRATLAVDVVSLTDWERCNPDAKVHVMKQSWQRLPGFDEHSSTIELANSSHRSDESLDASNNSTILSRLESTPFEAFVLEEAKLSDRLRDWGFVRAGGKKVDTFSYIRKGVQPSPKPSPELSKSKGGSYSSKKSPAMTDGGRDSNPRLQIPSMTTSTRATSSRGSASGYDASHDHQVNRSLVRLFFEHRGVPLSKFQSKRELLKGLRGAIADHEKLYRQGVIQRDVSPHNILLFEGEGHLIDFDHSKISIPRTLLDLSAKPESPARTREAFKQRLCDGFLDLFEMIHKEDAGEYLSRLEATRLFKLYPIPNFLERRAGPGYVTGTPAFASCHLKRFWEVPHTAIHDLESFLWALLYLCIVYSGPGSVSISAADIQRVLDQYFLDLEKSGPMKERAFRSANLRDDLLSHMHSDFEDLKPLIRDWFAVIKVAFDFQVGIEFNYPHQIILRLIDETLTQINDTAVNHEEVERRNQWFREVAEAVKSQQTVPRPKNTPAEKRSKNPRTDPDENQSSSMPSSATGPPPSKKQKQKN